MVWGGKEGGAYCDDIEMDDKTPLLSNYDAELSRASPEKLRLLVLGGDDALMDKACATILGERENRDAFQFGELMPRMAQVCGRQVSVLKTPFTWLKNLKSYFFFSKGVKSLKNDLQYYESLLFPGPHAFLLVHRDVKNSGREHYLLRALSEVFGEEVLDYCMVIFIDRAKHKDPKQNTCLKMCGGRYHILQNTDESVNQLFKKTETLTLGKHSDFFINHLECFRNAEIYFEAEYEEKMNKLSGELAENIETAENLKKEINDMKERNAKKVIELNERIKNDQKKSKDRENKLHNDLDAFRRRENQMMEDFQKLKEEMIIYKDRENMLLSGLDSFKISEKQMTEDLKKLKGELIIYKDRERHLKDDKEKLQREVERLKDNERQLQRNLTEAKELDRRVKELDDRQRNLIEREKQLEIRKREVRQRDTGSSEHYQTTVDTPSVSGDKTRPLDECEGELKSREHSQATESHGEPVRRNSKELKPPDMSESGPQHTP